MLKPFFCGFIIAGCFFAGVLTTQVLVALPLGFVAGIAFMILVDWIVDLKVPLK